MPTGYPLTEKEKERIVQLRGQGLAIRVISKRFGVHADTISKVIKEFEAKR